MIDLKIRFVLKAAVSPELDQKINEIDRLAFHSDSSATDDDKSDAGEVGIRWRDIRWGPLEWMALGFVGGELVTMLGLLRREILVGGEPLLVVGVGAVATHPTWQKRGLSTQLLQASNIFMRNTLPASFGLLVCGAERLSFYKRVGWKQVADRLFFTQDGRRYPLYDLPVMVLPLARNAWPAGEIDLCGSPW